MTKLEDLQTQVAYLEESLSQLQDKYDQLISDYQQLGRDSFHYEQEAYRSGYDDGYEAARSMGFD